MNALTVLLVATLCVSGSFCQIVVSGEWTLESLNSMATPVYVNPQNIPNQQYFQNAPYYFPQASPYAVPQYPSATSALSYPQYPQYPQYLQQTPYGGSAAPSPQKLIFVPSMAPGMNRFYPGYPTGTAPLTPCQLRQLMEAQNQGDRK